MVGFINNLFGKKKPEERRRSSLEEMGSKSQLSEEELQDLHDISERQREYQTIRPDGAARLRRLRQRPKRRRNRSRRRTPTNRTKRNTSLKSLRGEEDKYYDYTLSDTRPRDNYGYLIQPPPPEPTVQMRIHDIEEASGASKNHMGGKTRKRRRKRRRKTKRKGRRKTKKRRKMRKRKTRRKR